MEVIGYISSNNSKRYQEPTSTEFLEKDIIAAENTDSTSDKSSESSENSPTLEHQPTLTQNLSPENISKHPKLIELLEAKADNNKTVSIKLWTYDLETFTEIQGSVNLIAQNNTQNRKLKLFRFLLSMTRPGSRLFKFLSRIITRQHIKNSDQIKLLIAKKLQYVNDRGLVQSEKPYFEHRADMLVALESLLYHENTKRELRFNIQQMIESFKQKSHHDEQMLRHYQHTLDPLPLPADHTHLAHPVEGGMYHKTGGGVNNIYIGYDTNSEAKVFRSAKPELKKEKPQYLHEEAITGIIHKNPSLIVRYKTDANGLEIMEYAGFDLDQKIIKPSNQELHHFFYELSEVNGQLIAYKESFDDIKPGNVVGRYNENNELELKLIDVTLRRDKTYSSITKPMQYKNQTKSLEYEFNYSAIMTQILCHDKLVDYSSVYLGLDADIIDKGKKNPRTYYQSLENFLNTNHAVLLDLYGKEKAISIKEYLVNGALDKHSYAELLGKNI